MRCIGRETVSSLNTAKSLTVPDGTEQATIQAVTKNVRFTLEGTTPTSSLGQLLYDLDSPTLFAGVDARNFKGIEVAASATLEVHYFGR